MMMMRELLASTALNQPISFPEVFDLTFAECAVFVRRVQPKGLAPLELKWFVYVATNASGEKISEYFGDLNDDAGETFFEILRENGLRPSWMH